VGRDIVQSGKWLLHALTGCECSVVLCMLTVCHVTSVLCEKQLQVRVEAACVEL
jgi:hypothetical protein